uniref:Uncharacterized protein n=1 Tax=Arundo donax TaxID=35708 RepID=A0A0A9ATT7_ARUDO
MQKFQYSMKKLSNRMVNTITLQNYPHFEKLRGQ